MLALGLGDHWELNAKQTKDLGSALVGCSGDIPPTLIQAAQRHGGLARLAITGAIIVVPRVRTTMEIRNDPDYLEKRALELEAKRRAREQARKGFAVSTPPPAPPASDGFAYAERVAPNVESHAVGVGGVQSTNGSAAPSVTFKEGGFIIE